MLLKKILVLTLVLIFLGNIPAHAESALSNKEIEIVKISSLTAKGDQKNLETELNKALDSKMTVYEIKEILVQLYAYCGFPRSLNALSTFMKVTDERSAKGIYDEYGVEPVDLPKDSNRYEVGATVQTELVGAPVTGRLYEFEPAMDRYLKEHLFADIFARGVLTYEEREIATISALSSMREVEPQLKAHIQIGLNAGLKQEQIDEILKITNYKSKEQIKKEKETFRNIIFDRGNKNEAFSQYFTGNSYLNMLNLSGVTVANVTFEPKCRNNWHIHHKGGQILLVTQGRGYYQEWGQPARELKAGDVVNIPAEVKHWHGAAKDSWFVHIVIEIPAKNSKTEWLEPVDEVEYNKLK